MTRHEFKHLKYSGFEPSSLKEWGIVQLYSPSSLSTVLTYSEDLLLSVRVASRSQNIKNFLTAKNWWGRANMNYEDFMEMAHELDDYLDMMYRED